MITLRKLPLYLLMVTMLFFMLSRGIALADDNFISLDSSVSITTQISVEPATGTIPSLTDFSYSQPVDEDSANVAKQSAIVRSALSKYSPKLLNQSGLKGILLVKNLNWGGQHQVALPDIYDSGLLLISIDDEFTTAQSGQYITYVVHHELGHFFQHALNQRGGNDTDWKDCGTKDSEYGEGGLHFNGEGQDAWAIHPAPGFITSYSRASLEEDQAEIQARLQTDSDRLYKLADEDQILACKVKVQADRLALLSK